MSGTLNVLSLFDGMSCGQIALNEIGLKPANYFASEIDKPAIQITKKNYPNTKHLGDVRAVQAGKGLLAGTIIDLLIGGSPCQSFSFAGKQAGMSTADKVEILDVAHYLQLKEQGFKFEGQSYLFWEYVRILTELREANPDVLFLLENVKMQKKWAAIITMTLGVEPIAINSNNFTAASRQRLYWTNIPVAPVDETVKPPLKDFIDFDFLELYVEDITDRIHKKRQGTLAYTKAWASIKTIDQQAKCLTTGGQGISNSGATNISYEGRYYKPRSILAEALQGAPFNYTSGTSETQRHRMLGNGWNIPTIKHIFTNLDFYFEPTEDSPVAPSVDNSAPAEGINVLSLFDGMSCGQIALERLGVPVNRYFASEIDKPAIAVAANNYPFMEHIGDVTKVDGTALPVEIDLLIGGSPCQGFSFAGQQLNFDDPRSKLFFEFVRLLDETMPRYFLLENVKMKKDSQDIISKYLGCEPIEINSRVVSAQNRKRLYWTNIPVDGPPEDKGITLRDIIHEYCDGDMVGDINEMASLIFNTNPSGKGMGGSVYSVHKDKSTALMTGKGEGQKVHVDLSSYIVSYDKTLEIIAKEVEAGKIRDLGKGVYLIHDQKVTPGVDAGGYLFGCITPERVSKRQNGQRFNDGKKFYTLTAQDRHGILVEGYIRKLTPVECERLQTVPDGYTDLVAKTHRYKMLGNGWTVDVITHLLKNMKF